jgi:hypothetical protein
MNLKLLSTAALALSLAAAPAFAQSSGTGTGAGTAGGGGSPTVETDGETTASTNSNWTDAERTMYGENENWAGFFTDDTMGTVKTDAEVQAQFSAMGADDQAGMKAACERVNSDRGSYGSVTTALCAQIGEM